MRNIDENNLIWESYNQSDVITSMKIVGDMIQFKGLPNPDHINDITVNSKNSTIRIEQDEYKASTRIINALLGMGAEEFDLDSEFEDFRSGKSNLRNLERDLESRPHDAD